MGHDTAKDVVEVGPGIDVAGFARLDEAEIEGARAPATLTAGEHPVFSTQGQRPEGIFSGVVVGLEASVLEKAL